jgi:hypothetical protein
MLQRPRFDCRDNRLPPNSLLALLGAMFGLTLTVLLYCPLLTGGVNKDEASPIAEAATNTGRLKAPPILVLALVLALGLASFELYLLVSQNVSALKAALEGTCWNLH